MGSLSQPDIVERAYQLARSGCCGGVEDVRRELLLEGYINVAAHLGAGPALRKTLTTLCLQAQGRTETVRTGRLSGLRNQRAQSQGEMT